MPDLPAREQHEAALSTAIMAAVGKQEGRIKAGGADFSAFETDLRQAATTNLAAVYREASETMASAFGAALPPGAIEQEATQRAGAFARDWAAATTAAYRDRAGKAQAEAAAKDDETAALAILILLAFTPARAAGLACTEVTRAVTAAERTFIGRVNAGLMPDANIQKAADTTGGRGIGGDEPVVDKPPQNVKLPPDPAKPVKPARPAKTIDLPPSVRDEPGPLDPLPPPKPTVPVDAPKIPTPKPPPPQIPPAMGLTAVWATREDARVCPICRPIHNKIEKDWPAAQRDGPPAHPRCRCFKKYRLVPVADLVAAPEPEDLVQLSPEEVAKIEGDFTTEWSGVSPISDKKKFQRLRSKVRNWVADRRTSDDMETIYQSTQKQLAREGVTEIETFRGMTLSKNSPLARAIASGEVKLSDSIAVNKLEAVSYSEKINVASKFANVFDEKADREIGVIVRRVIPAKDVIASHRTQKHFFRGEDEIVAKSEGRATVEIVATDIDGEFKQMLQFALRPESP